MVEACPFQFVLLSVLGQCIVRELAAVFAMVLVFEVKKRRGPF